MFYDLTPSPWQKDESYASMQKLVGGALAAMLALQIAFCVGTVLCVLRVVKTKTTYSWDPPPATYGPVSLK